MKKFTALMTIVACMFIIYPSDVNAQFFKDVLDKTVDKTVEKTSEKVSEAASDEISDEAAEETRKGVGGVFGKRKKGNSNDSDASDEESDYNEEQYESDSRGEMPDLSGILGDFDRTADVPAAYNFDYSMDIEIQENDEEPMPMKMMVNREAGHFGITFSEKDQVSTMVYDKEKDLIVVYTIEDGEKRAMAMPNMVKAFGNNPEISQEIQEDMADFNWRATGRTKTIAGVVAKEYEGEDDEYKGTFYMAEDMPIDWYKSFASMFGQMDRNMFMGGYPGLQGMMLEAHTTEKKERKPDTTHYTTTRMGEETVSLKKSDFSWGME